MKQVNCKTSCALTGHRVLPQNFNNKLLYDELEQLIKDGCTTFFCGMAQGFDLLALKLLVELKERYPIYLEACVPFRGQENTFPEKERLLYRDLITRCDVTTVLFDSYKNGCYLARNRYMVDCSDILFAYCIKSTGGTAYTLRYANSFSKRVIFTKAHQIY